VARVSALPADLQTQPIESPAQLGKFHQLHTLSSPTPAPRIELTIAIISWPLLASVEDGDQLGPVASNSIRDDVGGLGYDKFAGAGPASRAGIADRCPGGKLAMRRYRNGFGFDIS